MIRHLSRLLGHQAALLRRASALGWLLVPLIVNAVPANFDVPAQSVASALLQFSQQGHVDVLFAFDDLNAVSSGGIIGTFEPAEALARLLRDTGFQARRSSRGKFVVTRMAQPTGAIKGRILLADGSAGRDLQVTIAGSGLFTTTESNGEFEFKTVRTGMHRLLVQNVGFRLLEIVDVRVDADRAVNVETHVLQSIDQPVQLAPQIVEGRFYRHWKV